MLAQTNDFPRLLASARAGQDRARDTLFQTYYPQVERIAHHHLRRSFGGRGTELAARFSTADVVQEVFHSLLKDLRSFEGSTEAEFITYVARIVRSRVIDSLRFHGASCRDYRRQIPAVQRSAENVLDELAAPVVRRGGDFALHLEAVLASFPLPERLLLKARIEENLGFAEIATRLKYTSRFAARRAFFAAQAKLLVRLGHGTRRSLESVG